MPSFQRLKYPFQRPTHYYTIHEPSPTPKQLETQQEKERQRAHDKIEDDLDDGRVGPRSSDLPDGLPVIIDRGPYRGHVYPRDQLFFNSIMLASDAEPIYAGPLGRELRQEVHRTPVRRPYTQREPKLPPRPVPNEYLTASQNSENLRRWEERNKTDVVGRTQRARPVPSEYLTAKQNAENMQRWEERNGRAPTTPRAQVRVRMPSLPRPPSPPRGPITPGTREWDSFMDFPLDNFVFADPSGEVVVDASYPVPILPTTLTPDTLQNSTAAPETSINRVLQTDPSPTSVEQSETLAWNSAFNHILHNETIDAAIRARIRERVQPSSTTIGLENEDIHSLAMTDAGLVPNFSYPIAGNEFHNRLHPRHPTRSRPLENVGENEEQQQEQLLSNSVSQGYYSSLSSSHTLYHSPTPTHLPLRGGNEESPTQLTNGIPPGYYTPSSSSSNDFRSDAHHHPPSPYDRVPEHVFVFLRSLLTPSELALHYDVIQDSAPPHPPLFPVIIPPSNATSATPVDVRLVQKLHTAVYGLQDRVIGVEEDLIPKLSTNLENKHLQVRQLNLENLSLQDEITDLKRILDFSNKALAGCCEREWEVWRTLSDIQRRREAYRGPLARIFSRASNATVQNNELLDSHRPEGYVTQPQLKPFGRAGQGPLKKKELDTLLLMVEQNVSILIEDLEEVTGLVKAFQESDEVEVLPMEGSWRDV